MRLNAQRAIAIVAALAGLSLIAAVPGAASGYWLAIGAGDWQTTLGRVTERTNVTLPSFACLVRDTRYSLIEYRYEGLDGKPNFGRAQAPLQGDIYPGGAIDIRFNPKNPAQSLPAVSIPGYRAAHGGTLLLAFPLAFGFLYTAKRLWSAGETEREQVFESSSIERR